MVSIQMTQAPQHLFASVRRRCEYRPAVTAIALLGLEVEGEGEAPVYMEIRFIDYDSQQVEGDHLMLSLEEALEHARADYGILQTDWRAMSQEEIDRIAW
ncbi:hypothetical protein K5D43_14795 [Pseudomonas cichorii]|uniref:Uncharacterized protein n=2 Tax=Pseudomonas lijiangensis TaxID=2995658 RepID=A0ABX8HY51_9PSED|nr:hypothetical protein [Pseudomonas lijiangensis]MBX8505140.1 hypothetical protein [Pseudomonas lijiangensis]MBX8555754.1 hypothetical protein [Pseudomonas cichorii]QWU85579.1 hypothetical protein KQP88_07080 [Pseudomonas lijiangensis]